MSKNIKTQMTGVALAIAAAGMVGCAQTGATSSSAQAATTDLVHCYGVNQCGGHNDCKTANNACAGHASCKGAGFVAMPSKACGDVGGKVSDEWTGSVAAAELVQCYGVNQCGGHNDCKTADNACGGHASCKGTGFVKMPAKACGDIGGSTDA